VPHHFQHRKPDIAKQGDVGMGFGRERDQHAVFLE
jgi:hypothetical protein